MGWPKPANILDLFVEFRDRTNGLTTPAGAGLVGALTYFGLDALAAQEKDEMRLLVLRGGPWSEDERAALLDYCATDTAALERLLPAMLPRIDLPRALLRGRYMAAAAAMESAGVPIDVPTLELLREHWTDIQDDLIARHRCRLRRVRRPHVQGRSLGAISRSRTTFPGRGSKAAGST